MAHDDNVQIQVSKGRFVTVKELREDQAWGAHDDWLGQLALKRYEETGDTGSERES